MKTLQSRLFSFFFLFLLVFALAASLISYLFLWQSNTKYVRSSTVNLCTSIKYNLDQEVALMNRVSLDTIYATQNYGDFETLQKKSYQELSKRHFDSIQNIYNRLFNIMGTDMNVNQINIYLRNNICIGNGFDTKFIPFEYESFPQLQEARKKQGSKLLITDSGVAKKSRLYGSYILLVRPFYNQAGEDAGIVEISQNKKRFFNYITSLSLAENQMEVYVFDHSTGALIYPYLPQEISALGKDYIQEFFNQSRNAPALEALSVANSVSGKRYALMYDRLETYSWEVVLVQPEMFVTAPFYKEISKFILIFVAILLFLTVAYRVMTKKILEPLTVLKTNVERVDMTSILSDTTDLIPNKQIKTAEIATLNHAFEKMYQDLKSSAAKILVMKERENEANYRALHALADPHFIFNSLTTISAMAEDNRNQDLIRMTNNLCQILRYSTNKQKSEVTIEEELFMMRRYLECIQIRYGSDLEFTIDVPEKIRALLIPKLAIQTLAENCIKHGFQVEPPFRVQVVGEIQDGRWRIDVSDNGVGFSPQVLEELQEKMNTVETEFQVEKIEFGGSGLINTFARMKLMNKNAFFSLENNRDAGCTVSLGGIKEN